MSDTTNQTKDQSEVIVNLDNLIKSHIKGIADTKENLKKHKDMFSDIFLNDKVYQEHDKKVKEVSKVRNATKAEIMKRSDVYTLNEKIKDMKLQVKELENALSEYIREYQRLTGANHIENESGDVLDIVYSVKLVKRKK